MTDDMRGARSNSAVIYGAMQWPYGHADWVGMSEGMTC